MKNIISEKTKNRFFDVVRRALDTSSFGFFEVEHSPDVNVTVHTHEIPHFIFIVRGTYNSEIKNEEVACPPATMLFHPVGTTHRDRFVSPGGKFFTISLDLEHVDYFQDFENLLNSETLKFHDTEIILLGTKMLNELRYVDNLTPIVLEGMTNELLAYVIRRVEKEEKDFPKWLELARELLHDRCTEQITISEIAKTVGVHPLHLNRTFRKFFRCSPGEYLRRCRIEFASRLLTNSETPLAEIALVSGFSDQSQFTKSFKIYSGITPGKFRRILS